MDALEPPPVGNVTLADAKVDIGDRLFIQRATDTLLAGKPGGRYILSTACSVAPHVEPWKLEIIVDIALEHGTQ